MCMVLHSCPFLGLFPPLDVDTVSGRQYPIDVLYTSEPQDDYLDAAMISCLQIHLEAPVRTLPSVPVCCFLSGSLCMRL